MGFSRSIGRIGPLAVALGVGLAVASAPGIAFADVQDSGSSASPANGSSVGSGAGGAGDGASSVGSDGTEPSTPDSVDDSSPTLDDADAIDEAVADVEDVEDAEPVAVVEDAEPVAVVEDAEPVAVVEDAEPAVEPAVEAAPATPLVSTVGELDHVFMVYMENKGYNDIVGSPDAPYLNSLINAYGFANNYFGLTHPSLPNYYPVIGGTDYGLTYECEAVCIFDHGTILTDNIDDAGLTWRGYAQSQPPGQPLEASGDYSVAQLPFVAFDGIGNNEAYAVEHLFGLDQMAIDVSSSETTPNFVWFAANEDFNGEGPIDFPWGMLRFAISQLSPTHQYNVPALDEFLSETVPVILNSVVWHDPAEKSVLVVTFDEDNDNVSLGFGDEGNHIVTVVIPSPAAVAGGMRGGAFIATQQYDHYSLLRMIEDSLGLPTLTNNDKWAVPMNEFWV